VFILVTVACLRKKSAEVCYSQSDWPWNDLLGVVVCHH